MRAAMGLDLIAQELFRNLQEHWELVHSMKQVEELNNQNRNEMSQKRMQLELDESSSHLLEEINEIQRIIDNSEGIREEIERCMELNVEE